MSALLAQVDFEVPPPTEAEILLESGGAIYADTTGTLVGLLNSYAFVFLVAFVVTLLGTPLVRRLAVAANIIDHPDNARKQHDYPVAYLGGVAVCAGVLAAIAVSFVGLSSTPAYFQSVPMAVIIGMLAITFTGLADDVWGWDPRFKIAGQLVAAAALAIEDVGVRVADGLLRPIMGDPEVIITTIGSIEIINHDVFYWVGIAIIAIFVLGGSNAANLIDGLDGLLTGIVAIAAVGLLAVSLMMAARTMSVPVHEGTSLAGARIILCLALLGAALGFLPHNFNPASIFLGDCGSHLLGYLCAVIILMLGENGQTHLVFAGLIIFAVPIIDTMLAMIRRKLAGVSMSTADEQHLHHQLRRGLKSVKKAAFALYGIGAVFAVIGVALAALVMFTELRIRVLYVGAIVLFGFIGVLAVKTGRRRQWLEAAAGKSPVRATPARTKPPVEVTKDAPASKPSTSLE